MSGSASTEEICWKYLGVIKCKMSPHAVYLFYFIKGRFEELPHQLHLDPQHSLLGPLQVSAAELVDGLPNLQLSMLT